MTDAARLPEVHPAACTAMRVRKAARRVTQIYDTQLEPFGLTITQYGLLGRIKALDGLSIGELAEKMLMDPTTLTRSLRPLQRRGLLVLAPDPRDKRSRSLHLTERGREAFDQARSGWQKAQRHIVQTLGDKETAALHAALDRMVELLAE
jgi:DNA-binding MarR family transcriptional regulator